MSERDDPLESLGSRRGESDTESWSMKRR